MQAGVPGVVFVLSWYCFLSGNLKDVPSGTLVLIVQLPPHCS